MLGNKTPKMIDALIEQSHLMLEEAIIQCRLVQQSWGLVNIFVFPVFKADAMVHYCACNVIIRGTYKL
jgi:hypothetical protein